MKLFGYTILTFIVITIIVCRFGLPTGSIVKYDDMHVKSKKITTYEKALARAMYSKWKYPTTDYIFFKTANIDGYKAIYIPYTGGWK
jgi:hypothetical protein